MPEEPEPNGTFGGYVGTTPDGKMIKMNWLETLSDEVSRLRFELTVVSERRPDIRKRSRMG